MVFQHVQKEFVEHSVVGIDCREEGLGGIIRGLDAVGTAVTLEVEQASCMKSQISWGAGDRTGLHDSIHVAALHRSGFRSESERVDGKQVTSFQVAAISVANPQ